MTVSSPKISIIIPVYNVEKYIGKCLESLIAQTFRDIEIICVDDCSADKSADIIEQFAARDSRIKLIRQAKNGGMSVSRNTALANSGAPYVMFCDSDDFYQPNMCEKMFNLITENNADMAVCEANIIYETDDRLKKSDDEYYKVKYSGKVAVSDEVVCNCDVSAWNKIHRRDILDKYDIRFPVGLKYEDAYFFRAYALWAKTIVFTQEKLYNYRRRVGSIMNQTFKKDSTGAIDHLIVAIEFFKYLNAHDLYTTKYEYFWKSVFIPYFYLAMWWTYDRKGTRALFDLAAPFVKQHYKGDLGFATSRTLRMIANKTLNQTQKHLGGIIATKENLEKKVIRFCAIPVFKIKFFEWGTKYYLFGIQILRRRTK